MSAGSETTPKGRPTPRRPANGPTGPATAAQEPTSAREWRSARRNGITVTLPSGQRCRLRRTFNMMNLIESGEIPNPLGAYISEAVKQAQEGGTPEAGQLDLRNLDQSTPDGRRAFAQFLEMMMKSMSDIFVEPRVLQVPEGEDARTWEPGYRKNPETGEPELVHPEEQDCLSVVDIDLQDQMYAFSWAQGGADSMASFRQEQDKAVDAAQDGEVVQL